MPQYFVLTDTKRCKSKGFISKKISVLLVFFFVSAAGALAQTKGGKVMNTNVQKVITGNTYAIIFGVSNYPGLTPLKYADKDAALFRDFLQTPAGGSAKPENIFFRTNENAKAADFNIDAYSWLKRKALKEGDRLYIYFSGHGDAMNEDNYFLLPYDCTPQNDVNNYLATGRIEMYHVKTLFIKPLIPKKVDVLLIVDACRTNDLPGGEQGQQNFVNYVQSIAEQKEGDIIMLSAGAGQSAIESPKIGGGHGLFTWYLIAGLSGDADKEGDAADHDGKVSMAEITSYVKNKVRREAKTLFNSDQVPVFLPPDKDLETIAMVDSGTYNNWKLAENMLGQAGSNGTLAAVINKKAGKKAVTANSLADTALIALDNKFIAAIKAGNLSGKNSAEEFYNRMQSKWPEQTLTGDARYALATEFINFGQDKINLYLSGKGLSTIRRLENHYKAGNKPAVNGGDAGRMIPAAIEEQLVHMKTVASTGFDKAADMMDKAVSLLKGEPELLTSLYPKLYFLKAGSLQTSANTFKRKQAVNYVKKAITQDKTAAYNYQLLADLMNNFSNDSCTIYYNKAIQLAPKWAYPENGLGNYYSDKGNYKLALAHYANAIKLDSLDEIIYQNIGSLYHNQGKPDSAKKYYLKALAIDSCDFYASANMGSLYKDSLAATKMPRYFKLAHYYLKRSTTCNSSYAWAYRKLAQVFDLANLSDSSIYYCNAGIQKNPENASLYRTLGDEYLYRKDTLSAEKYYRQALATDSLDLDNYLTLGWLYRRKALNVKVLADAGAGANFEKALSSYKHILQIDPGNAIAYNNIGVVYNDLKLYDKAVASYKKAIQLDTAYTLAYNNLGNLYYYRKDYSTAIPYYQKAIQHDTAFASAYLNLGLIYLHDHAYSKAQAYFQRSLYHDPEDALVYISIGNVYYQKQEYSQAILWYVKSLKISPDNFLPYVYIGDAYRFIKQFDKAKSNYDSALKLMPNSATAYSGLGDLYYDKKEYDKALLSYQRSAEIDPAQRYIYVSIGDVYAQQRLEGKAIACYQKAITIDSSYATAYNSLGSIYYGRKDYTKAAANFRKAVAADSSYASAYFNLGLVASIQKDDESAVKCYEKVIAIDPAKKNAITNLGDIYRKRRDFDKAAYYYAKALSLSPVTSGDYNAMGSLYYDRKDYSPAIVNYERALQLDSTSVVSYFNLGLVYENQKEYRKAIYDYNKAIKFYPGYTYAYLNLGFIYYSMKNYPRSIINYKKAIQLDSASAVTYFNLGQVYDALKEWDNAIQCYKRATAIAPLNGIFITSLGYDYIYKKEFATGIAYLERAKALFPNDPYSYYNLACASSLSGDMAKGMEYLKSALTRGYKDYEHIQKDDDLANLKRSADFDALLKQYFPDKQSK